MLAWCMCSCRPVWVPPAYSVTDADYRFVGENDYDGAGSAVGHADVDGDGRKISWWVHRGRMMRPRADKAYVFLAASIALRRWSVWRMQIWR